jgi:hypothetical protein
VRSVNRAERSARSKASRDGCGEGASPNPQLRLSNGTFLGFKKNFKKVKKKLATPLRIPLHGEVTRQGGLESRSKKLWKK